MKKSAGTFLAVACVVPALIGVFFGSAQAGRRAPGDLVEALRARFAAPPDEARPWVYWFWLNGNITREGITADLEAMKRAGIGGVLIMEVDQGTPAGPVSFAGSRWRELFRHVLEEADRLGLQVNMNNDAGWCGSGGPWIKPEQSMQRVVWTETEVRGPGRVEAALARPEAAAGFYRDIAVVAFPSPAGRARIPNVAVKSAARPMDFFTAPGASLLYPYPVWPEVPATATVPRDGVRDLTAAMDAGGRLEWDAPAGPWTILRLGHASTGKDNHPAPESGRGLECDKLSPEAVDAHFAGLMGKLVADAGPLAGRSLVSTHIDSWELGSQNWTPRFREEFLRRRGYDLFPFFPALAGRVVESREVSERFLWDVRQTVSDLLLENYAGRFRDLAHRNGLRLSIEAYTNVPADELAYAGRADEPMGEFWSWWFTTGKPYGYVFSATEMASAAHVYGKRIVGAEAFTACDAERWLGYPGNIKELGDWAFTEGINRFVFHRYALQPWPDIRPGMSMGPWGLHYERTQTWWDMSRAWHEYLARCQDVLRQGLYVADVCYLTPEGSRHSAGGQKRFKSGAADNPEEPRERTAFHFDLCPPEALLERMSVRDGRLVLPDGMSYRLLVLPGVETMTPRLLEKVRGLLEAGATVVGPRPSKSPSLAGYPGCDEEVRKSAEALWGAGEAPAMLTERRVGRGLLFWSAAFQPALRPGPEPRESLGQARWIWTAEGEPAKSAPPGARFFRRSFKVDAGRPVASARLVITADNRFACRINGQPAGSGNDHSTAYEFQVASLLVPGANVVAVEATNATGRPSAAGLIASLVIRYRDGRQAAVRTDAAWEAAATVPEGQTIETTPAGIWSTARDLGPFGTEPWGSIDQACPEIEIYAEEDLVAEVLARLDTPPDFRHRAGGGEPSLRYIHRTLDDADIYFVANRKPAAVRAVCEFRVRGKRPEIWDPATGLMTQPAQFDLAPEGVRLPLEFEPHGSLFVVFDGAAGPAADRIVNVTRGGKDAAAGQIAVISVPGGGFEAEIGTPGRYALTDGDGHVLQIAADALPESLEISGPWDVRFGRGGGAPERVAFDRLASWSEHPDEGVRHFSGVATYRKTLDIPAASFPEDGRLALDLGDVRVMASVKLNGRELGTLWKAPYRIDITAAAKRGKNSLEVEVVNLWINRMIGDEALPEDGERNPDGTLKAWPKWLEEGRPGPAGRRTFASWKLWRAGEPLHPSGLLGPVRIVTSLRKPVPR